MNETGCHGWAAQISNDNFLVAMDAPIVANNRRDRVGGVAQRPIIEKHEDIREARR
jgi:hypothetical protein